MDDETSNIMNLDLNLGPAPEAGSVSLPSQAVYLDDWIDNHVERIREVVNDRIEIMREAVAEPIERIREAADSPIERIREAVRIRARQRRRWRQLQVPRETQTLSVELNQLIGNSGNVGTLQAGEGSVAAEERTNEVPKMCENISGFLEDEVSEKKSDVEKGTANDGSFFDCNICLDLATDPVVTCCGHLFCWSCLYQWLHGHSDAKECPVCRGEVTTKNVTPIYGCGSNTHQPKEDASLEVPLRPQARRVESLRQTIQRSSFSFPVEMIWRLGSRFHESNGARELADRTNSFLNRIMTYGGMRAEQNSIVQPDDILDSTHNGTTSPEAGPARRLQSVLLQRLQAQSQRSSNHSSFSSALNSAEGLIDANFRNHPVGRNQEQPQPIDDRDSFSSIASVINSESQMDTAVEIDSMVSLSTSSSRRRHDALRISDVDSGDSRAPQRRRMD